MPDSRETTRKLSDKAVRSTLAGIAVNGCLVAVKGVTGVLGHSYALIADAMESFLDIFQGLIVLSGLRIAATVPDATHPYGHGKAEPLAAMVAAICLLAGACGIAVASLEQILSPRHVGPATFTLPVIILVIVTKEVLFRRVLRVGKALDSTAVKVDAWHHRSDAFTSTAVFIGILIGVVGGEGYETADDWAALAACAIIGWNGYRLLLPALGEVMDAAPPPEVEDTVRRAAQAVEGVIGLDACLVRKMGFEFFVDLHVCVNGDMPVREGHGVAHRVKDAIRAAVPRVHDVLVHIEPEEGLQHAARPENA